MPRRLGTLLLAGLLFTPAALAQTTSTPTPPPSGAKVDKEAGAKAEALGREARLAGAAGDLAKARDLFRQQLVYSPGDFQARYNLARVESKLGNAEAGLIELRAAIETGFDDLRRLRRDPFMQAVRDLDVYKKLDAAWGEVLDAHLGENIAFSRTFAPPESREIRDDELRIVIITNWDEEIIASSRQELSRLSQWAQKTVFPGLLDASEKALDPWVVVVLPDKAGFERWQEWYFGAKPMAPGGYAAVGGAYDHDTKRLVARDLGSTLRHEFMHVLHWRMCVRAGQIHPVWLQEGLCSLVEDYDLKDGSLRPAPSYRTNTAKRLTKAGGLLTIAALTSLDRDHFIGTRPMANYAQARTLFMFISDRQRLGDWYAEFTRRWSGVNTEEATRGAFEAALRMPMDEVEKSYRAYVRAMPEVPEQLASGRASLGVVVETGAGDGPVVVEVVRRDGAGLKLGDVVISIDGKPTRVTPELVRVLGTSLDGCYAPGASVVVRVKRDGKQIDVPLTLVPR